MIANHQIQYKPTTEKGSQPGELHSEPSGCITTLIVRKYTLRTALYKSVTWAMAQPRAFSQSQAVGQPWPTGILT